MGRIFNLWNVVAGYSDTATVRVLSELNSAFAENAEAMWYHHGRSLYPILGRSHVLEGHKRPVNCLVHAGETMLISGGADGSVRLWCTATGESVGHLEGHEDYVYCVLAIDRLNLVASGSKDCTVRLWTIAGEQAGLFGTSPTNSSFIRS